MQLNPITNQSCHCPSQLSKVDILSRRRFVNQTIDSCSFIVCFSGLNRPTCDSTFILGSSRLVLTQTDRSHEFQLFVLARPSISPCCRLTNGDETQRFLFFVISFTRQNWCVSRLMWTRKRTVCAKLMQIHFLLDSPPVIECRKSCKRNWGCESAGCSVCSLCMILYCLQPHRGEMFMAQFMFVNVYYC